jgi:hypothetical protein
MTRGRFLAFSIACLLTVSVVAAGSASSGKSLTVGDFAVMVASRINPGEATSQELTPAEAASLLEKSGVKVKADLASPLTEAQAADIFSQLGITLQAAGADDLLDSARAASLVDVFGTTIAANGNKQAGAFGVKAKGPGTTATGAGTITLDLTPADCQALPRPPAPCDGPQSVCNPCMDCCKNQLGLTGKVCGRLCQKKNLVSSPTEPTP